MEKVLSVRKALEVIEEDGYPTEEWLYETAKKVRRQMVVGKSPGVYSSDDPSLIIGEEETSP